jgi:hypothetical protein
LYIEKWFEIYCYDEQKYDDQVCGCSRRSVGARLLVLW